MRYIISAGGTGGHIYPAISIINKIKKEDKNSSFLYIGTNDRMEKDLIPSLNIDFVGIEISGLSKNIFKSFKSLIKLIKAKKRCKEIIVKFKPDIVIGVGGYVTVPVIETAHKLGIKTIIHEQNSIPGKANKYMGRFVDKVCISMKENEKYFSKEKIVFTGNPRGEEVLLQKPIKKKDVGFDDGPLIVITTGSLGSSTVNDKITSAFSKMASKDYNVLFITGKAHFNKYSEYQIYNNIKIVPYVDNMGSLLKITDLLITRSGATIISEITSIGIPSILIPSPYVANNHQYYNAKYLVDHKCAVMLEEKDLTVDNLLNKIDLCLDNKRLQTMKINAKKEGVVDSASRIYQVILALLGNK